MPRRKQNHHKRHFSEWSDRDEKEHCFAGWNDALREARERIVAGSTATELPAAATVSVERICTLGLPGCTVTATPGHLWCASCTQKREKA